MNSNGAILVMFSHLLACNSSDTETPFTAETMFRCWVTFSALVIGPNLLSGQSVCWEHRCSTINRTMAVVCICVVANAALSVFVGAGLSYCFLLHSMCSIACRVAADNLCSHSCRVIMVLTVVALLFGMHVFPVTMPVATLHVLPPSPCMTFETAHLWAFICTVLAQGLGRVSILLAERW
jgi:hypothetical protein